ncbi:MAG: cytochrome c [Planctomycetota bacterium]
MKTTSCLKMTPAMAAILVLWAGCSKEDSVDQRYEDKSVGRQPGHWIHDEEIRALMSSVLFDSTWPSKSQDVESSDAEAREEALEQAEKLAEALADAGERLPEMVDPSQLSEADFRGFETMAATLHDQAVQLGEFAEQGKIEQMQRQLDAIDRTCIACHSRYRDLTGMLSPREARDATTSTRTRMAAVTPVD